MKINSYGYNLRITSDLQVTFCADPSGFRNPKGLCSQLVFELRPRQSDHAAQLIDLA
jgi:hypothetical protein